MNLCTDQLAMLIAKPQQLLSVSYLAADPSASLLAERAQGLHHNRGLAEDIVRLKPDLILAGTYTTRATVNLLKRLGFSLVQFKPAYSFADIRQNILKMGAVLGREQAAAKVLETFEQQLGQSGRYGESTRLVIGSYGANSYTTGASSLESEIVEAGGYAHLGSQLQLSGTVRLPLELLIMADPDILMTWQHDATKPDRASAILKHPALKKWFADERQIRVDSRYWICGTPYTVQAIQQLQDALSLQEQHHE